MNNILRATLIATIILSISLPAKAQQTNNISNKQIKEYISKLPFKMEAVKKPAFKRNTISITQCGAVPDGKTLNTRAFETAIAKIAESGGGTVTVPAGVWLTGPIALKSNVQLYTEKNSLIIFAPDFNLYPLVDTNFEGLNTKRCQSPISALNAQNIAITGHGIIDGSGDAWRPVKKEKTTERQFNALIKKGGILSADKKIWYPSEASLIGQNLCVDQNIPVGIKTESEWLSIKDFLRPVMVSFVNCKDILLEGVTFQNSPAWNIHPFLSENIIINNVTVRNPWYSQNGDGIDLESCKNALIVNSNFDVGDDAICMKSGKNEEGRKRNKPTENVIIDNCTVYHGHGGFVVGSEMSGGIRNIKVSNCTFIGTDVGLRFKSTRGRGGIVENIYIDNINMTDIPTDPLLFDLFYGGKSPAEADYKEVTDNSTKVSITEETPLFRNIFIDGIISKGSDRAMFFNGLPEQKIQNISVSNSFFESKTGAVLRQVNGVTLRNITIDQQQGKKIELVNVDNANIDKTLNSAAQ